MPASDWHGSHVCGTDGKSCSEDSLFPGDFLIKICPMISTHKLKACMHFSDNFDQNIAKDHRRLSSVLADGLSAFLLSLDQVNTQAQSPGLVEKGLEGGF